MLMKKISFLMVALALSASGVYADSDVSPQASGRHERTAHSRLGKWLKTTPSPMLNAQTALSAQGMLKTQGGLNVQEILRAPQGEAQEHTLWAAQKQTLSLWISNAWMMVYDYTIEYNDKGQGISQVNEMFNGQKVKQTFQWNENNLPVYILSQLDNGSGTYVNVQQLQCEYDTKVNNFVTLYALDSWSRNTWYTTEDSYKNLITRDEAGNVVVVDNQEFVTNDYRPEKRVTVEYGTDGKATEIDVAEYEGLDGSGNAKWEYEEVYSDIVWLNTDGQILNPDNLFQGNNRILNCAYQDEELIGMMEVEYSDNGSFSAHISGDNEVNGEHEEQYLIYEVLDGYGSVKTTVYVEYSVGGEVVEKEEIMQTKCYDQFGLVTLQEVKETANDRVVESQKIIGEVEYDPTYGYPVTLTLYLCDPDTDEPTPAELIEYSDYIGFSGIDAIETAGSDTPAVYYDMQGRRVVTPAKGGIYIRRTGLKTEKIIVR